MTVKALGVDGYWLPVKDGDDRARALYLRHYSAKRYADNRERRRFVPSGARLILLSPACDALFVWHHPIVERLDGQTGANCTVFRNESAIRSSDLIREAMDLAWVRWPGERLFTYVNAAKIRSTNPGYCFLAAGWQCCGMSKGGLVILECLPEWQSAEQAN